MRYLFTSINPLNKKFIYKWFVLLTIFFTSCISNQMQISNSQIIEKVKPNESQVIFLRTSYITKAYLFDVTNNELNFIGVLGNQSKIAFNTTPGKHTFMVVSEAADFMEADLSPGKTYYSSIRARTGAWKARFTLYPIRIDGSSRYNTDTLEYKESLISTKLVKKTENAEKWFQNNKETIRKKQADYWVIWKQKTASALAERTLNPQDGL